MYCLRSSMDHKEADTRYSGKQADDSGCMF